MIPLIKKINNPFYNFLNPPHNLRFIYTYVYIIIILLGIYINYPAKLMCKYGELKINNIILMKNLNVSFEVYLIAIFAITLFSYMSFLKFESFKNVLKEEAQKIGLEEKALGILENRILNYPKNYLALFTTIPACLLSYLFINYTRLPITNYTHIKNYAYLVVFLAALSVILASVSLITLIFSIRGIYKLKFTNYVQYYPIATNIFNEFNYIVRAGLVRFWIVSGSIIILAFLVLTQDAYFVFCIVLSLVIVGFVFFSLYPYYFTKRKIIELKIQTIGDITTQDDFRISASLDDSLEIIKLIEKSPTQISTNFQTLIWSSTTVILGIVLPIIFR